MNAAHPAKPARKNSALRESLPVQSPVCALFRSGLRFASSSAPATLFHLRISAPRCGLSHRAGLADSRAGAPLLYRQGHRIRSCPLPVHRSAFLPALEQLRPHRACRPCSPSARSPLRCRAPTA